MPRKKACMDVMDRTARVRRFRLKAINEGQQVAKRALLMCEGVNKRVERVLSDEDFVKLMQSMGIASAPRLFSQPNERTQSIDSSVKFVIGWSFFFPLFDDVALRKQLRKRWPGFIEEMKDAFIALVLYGHFPPAQSIFEVQALMRTSSVPFKQKRKRP
jgi:hypothetical protein